MNDNANKRRACQVWLITGCSSGLGRQLVLAALARGDQVVATARRLRSIEDLPETPNLKRLELDVTSPESSIQEIVKRASNLFGTIDVLVNNAGFVVSGVVEELGSNDFQQQIDANVLGAIKMTRAILPLMREQRSGVILFMGSISGWLGVGAGSAYSASKYALEGIAESLSKEVRKFGVRVHILVLGQFRTPILSQGRKKGPLETESGFPEYAHIKKEMSERHVATHGLQPGDPEMAAHKMIDIVKVEGLGVEAFEIPLRVPLGSDAVQVMRAKCQDTLQMLEGWEKFAGSTDFPDANTVPSYYR